MELNEKQQLALRTDRHIAVTAGAGTGKTRVLVERYAGIVCAGNENRADRTNIENVLALTFTEKAAAEMKNRVRDTLRERLLAARNEQELRRGEELFENFRDPRISTFHSFCAAVLREFPIEAGVDPAFDILDEPRAAATMERALHDFLDEKNTAGDPDLRALAALCDRAALAARLRALAASRFPARRWAERTATLDADQIENDYRELANKWLLSGDRRGSAQNLLDRLGACECLDSSDILAPAYFESQRFFQTLLASGEEDFEAMAGIKRRGGKKDSWDDVKLVRALLGEARDLAAKLAAFRFGPKDAIAAAAARALARLFLAFLDRCEQARGRGAALDFDDLEIKTLHLLENAPAVRRALRNRFRFILIDEFQDTNNIQWEIIRKIAVDESERLACNVFIVGDEKQSIYAFRGANVAVFERARGEMAACNAASARDAGRVALDVCYRSHPALIRFFNTVFTQIFEGDPAEDFLTKIEYFNIEAGRKDAENGDEKRVEFLLLSGDGARRDPGLPPAWEVEAAMAADRILELEKEGAQFGDIAILFRGRTHLRDYTDALRERGIPFNISGGLGFFDRPEVLDLLNVLSFLSHPGDNVSLAGVLRSPLLGLSDEDLTAVSTKQGRTFWDRLRIAADDNQLPGHEIIRDAYQQLYRWRALAGRIPVSDLLRRVCGDACILAVVCAGPSAGRQRANIEKLFDMARGFEHSDAAGINRFLDRVNNMMETGAREAEAETADESRDAVRIMTVHAAKGLEFPVVIVPGMSSPARWNTSADVIVDEIEPGIFETGFPVPDPENEYAPSLPVVRNVIGHIADRREQEQFKRLLYVACTRARERLILAGVREAALNNQEFAGEKALAHWDALIADALNRGGAGMEGVRVIVEPDTDTLNAAVGYVHDFKSPCIIADTQPVDAPYLMPLARDAQPGMSFTVTEILAFIKDRNAYFRRYVLGEPATVVERKASRIARDGMDPLLRGSLAHKLFQHAAALDPAAARTRAGLYLREAGVTGPPARDFLGRYLPALDAFRIAFPFVDDTALRELPFSIPVARWTVNGAMDLVFHHHGQWRVIDYKTDRIAAAGIPDRDAHYRPQVELYALALIAGRPDIEQVSAALYFTEPQQAGAATVINRNDAQKLIGDYAGILEQMEKMHIDAETFPAYDIFEKDAAS